MTTKKSNNNDNEKGNNCDNKRATTATTRGLRLRREKGYDNDTK
jgi:hypothetical protein